MTRFFAIVGLILIVAGIMAGCRSTKKIRKAITSTTVQTDTTGQAARTAAVPVRDVHADSVAMIHQAVTGLNHNYIDFQSFSGRMHVHYQGADGKNNELIAFVRIKKDSLIWISVNANVGPVTIEVFRMLVTHDSVKILDKQKKLARIRSVSYLKEQVNLPVDFGTLQNLLIGNPIFWDTTNVLYYRTEKKGISLFSIGAAFSNFLTLNPDFTPMHSKMDDIDPLRARTCDITYGDYNLAGVVPFSTYRKISVAEKSKVDIEIAIKQYKFNEPLSTPFSIPKNYKRR